MKRSFDTLIVEKFPEYFLSTLKVDRKVHQEKRDKLMNPLKVLSWSVRKFNYIDGYKICNKHFC